MILVDYDIPMYLVGGPLSSQGRRARLLESWLAIDNAWYGCRGPARDTTPLRRYQSAGRHPTCVDAFARYCRPWTADARGITGHFRQCFRDWRSVASGQSLVGNTEQSVERRLDGVPPTDSDVAV